MNFYTGFHAVEEQVRRIAEEKEKSSIMPKILYAKPGPRIKKILSQAQEAEIPTEEVSLKELDDIASKLPALARDHRGIILCIEGEKEKPSNEVQLDQWISNCPQTATVVILDSVTDPHNVGAIVRSLDQFGADLLVIPEKRSASKIAENEIIARSSAGSSAWVPIATVTNLVRAAQMLKDAGFWIYGADAGGSPLQKTSFSEKTCIVMGSEGNGIARLLSQQCDQIISIPTCGKIDSLNVSVAAGILLYERHRQNLEAEKASN